MKTIIKDNQMKVKKILLASFFVFSFLFNIEAKDKKGVVMTIDNEEVPTEEFLYLFQKNNQQQGSPQSIDEYLDLFVNYRLKVAEAKSLGVDTTAAFKKEVDIYKTELLEPYIADSVFFNKLLDDAWARENMEMESSHIMIIRTNDEEKNRKNLAMLDSIRNEILNGADFANLAKLYSQDKFSSDKGGYLGFHPAGTFPYAFETAVFETPEGDISGIVESHVGWHIVKSGAKRPVMDMNTPIKTREMVKEELSKIVSSPADIRYNMVRENTVKNLRIKHPEVSKLNLSPEEEYRALIAAEAKDQYSNNAEYRNLVNEYVNGSLLYEVSVENIWNKAGNDEEGLQKYYASNKDKYTWDQPHAKGILVQTVNDSIANEIRKAATGLPVDSVVPMIKKQFKEVAMAERFNVTKGKNPMIDYLMFGGEVAKSKFRNFAVNFIIDGEIQSEPQSLDDVRPSVISDYQDVLEKEWLENLKRKHKVEINKKELGNIRKCVK